MIGKRSVQNFLFRDELELYDLQNDPDEIHNRASDPQHLDQLRTLLAKLHEHCHATADPWRKRHKLLTAEAFGRDAK